MAGVGYTAVKRKKDRFDKIFSIFPQCKLELTGVSKTNKRPYRWERIKQICPDFDIFIDDSTTIMKESLKFFAGEKEKNFVLPDYKYSAKIVQGKNVYRVKTTVSDLKDEDFVIAALEMKNKKLEEELKSAKQSIERERERERERLKATSSLSSLC